MSALLDRLEELARAVGTDPIRPAVLTAADLRFQAAATPRVVLRLLAVARAAEAFAAEARPLPPYGIVAVGDPNKLEAIRAALAGLSKGGG